MRLRFPLIALVAVALPFAFSLSRLRAEKAPGSRASQAGSAKAQTADSAASIGLDVGQEAPAFSLPDQFGRQQSNRTLKGSNGTVLLFFRSADW